MNTNYMLKNLGVGQEPGFPYLYVKWVMHCLTYAFYAILVNWRPPRTFLGAKDLRQRDPYCPCLFTLGMEYLSIICD